MTDKSDQLKEIRKKITETDEKMAELFRQRMELVEQVGEYKKANALPVYDPDRERQVLMEGAQRMERPEFRARMPPDALGTYFLLPRMGSKVIPPFLDAKHPGYIIISVL